MKKFNPFHLVEVSPWPFFTSLSILSFALGVIIMVRMFICIFFFISLIFLLFSSFIWGRDIHREGCYLGSHNIEALDGFKLGMVFFILSECFFFLGMFWGYFHLAEIPSFALGGVWPPTDVLTFDPKGIPFLNTVLLVSSGISVTWSHHSLESGGFKNSLLGLLFTILLGFIFTFFQFIEYYVASFTISCSSYSSIYFMGTGFHGFHVIIGTMLLLICLIRFSLLSISPLHSSGFECSIWYWHFVDVVWFFLYLVFYWWGV
uniref:Cytochrome c oxidase subunit 3 n=1 Tax=Histiostoma feroniarum TaxID=334618 RepID=A0A2Z4MAL2_9ACAR|nr:cytochrome c oxidase subunit III [Histiostoma feroniarum]AWX53522.1 cytochrome oxidase subunit 3 [Histiostoma feroniarum]